MLTFIGDVQVMFLMVFSICQDPAGCNGDQYIRIISEPFPVNLTLNANKRWELDYSCDEARERTRMTLPSELSEVPFSTLCVRQDIWNANKD